MVHIATTALVVVLVVVAFRGRGSGRSAAFEGGSAAARGRCLALAPFLASCIERCGPLDSAGGL